MKKDKPSWRNKPKKNAEHSIKSEDRPNLKNKCPFKSLRRKRRRRMTTASLKNKLSRLKIKMILKRRMKMKTLTSLAKVSLIRTSMAILRTRKDAPEKPRDSKKGGLIKPRKMCSTD